VQRNPRLAAPNAAAKPYRIGTTNKGKEKKKLKKEGKEGKLRAVSLTMP